MSRLVLKELRETLRDRRTIITLILMPLLVYPALSLVFKSFLLSQAGVLPSQDPIKFNYCYTGSGSEEDTRRTLDGLRGVVTLLDAEAEKEAQLERERAILDAADLDDPNSKNEQSLDPASQIDLVTTESPPMFAAFRDHRFAYFPPDQLDVMKEAVDQGFEGVHAALYIDREGREPWQLGTIKLIARQDSISQAAVAYLEKKIKAANRYDIKRRLQSVQLSDKAAIEVEFETIGLVEGESAQAAGGSASFPLASIVPLILVLMTITGAVYPAIDLTAGERERGTLETLMAAPIPRFGILFSKFLAVLTVAMLTATLNIGGMFATVWAFQLDKQFGGGMFGFDVMIKMLLLLVLFAAFFSAILLVVTSFAKSFKEAQVYLIPVILLSLGPGLLALAPGMELAGPYAFCPMINILLLARDVINGSVELIPATIAIVSTIGYSIGALCVAARIFGSDAILYADSSSFAEMIQRPRKSNWIVPFGATLFCLVMLLPLNFASVGLLSRMPSTNPIDFQSRFLAMGAFLFLVFLAFPTLVAIHQRTNLRTGFGLKLPRPVFWVIGLILGMCLWPIVMSLTEVWQHVYGLVAGAEAQSAWKEKLLENTQPMVLMIRQVPPWVILLSFSILPALCEEWFFRGMLMRTLLKEYKPWIAILVTAGLFGVFHMISNSVISVDRLIPTTLIGLVLGFMAYKSSSIWPGVILHSVHNAVIVFLGYYQLQLMELPWFPKEEDPIPMLWVISALVVVGVAIGGIALTKRSEDPFDESLPDEGLANNGISEDATDNDVDG